MSDCMLGELCSVYPVVHNYGTDDLGHAMAICATHQRYSTTITIPEPRVPNFADGWDACQKVWSKWQDSEEARKQREAEAEVERQRQFVTEFVRGLK